MSTKSKTTKKSTKYKKFDYTDMTIEQIGVLVVGCIKGKAEDQGLSPKYIGFKTLFENPTKSWKLLKTHNFESIGQPNSSNFKFVCYNCSFGIEINLGPIEGDEESFSITNYKFGTMPDIEIVQSDLTFNKIDHQFIYACGATPDKKATKLDLLSAINSHPECDMKKIVRDLKERFSKCLFDDGKEYDIEKAITLLSLKDFLKIDIIDGKKIFGLGNAGKQYILDRV